jgi:hypothetical protein
MSERQTNRYEITEDMMMDIARDLNHGATWAELENQYGIPAASLKRAYLRKTREFFGFK